MRYLSRPPRVTGEQLIGALQEEGFTVMGRGPKRGLGMQAVERAGIPARGYSSPVHPQLCIRERMDTRPGARPVTGSIALPFHGNLAEEHVEEVVEGLKAACGR